MGQMSGEHDWRNCQERAQKGCMPFCYHYKNFVSEMVSSQRSITTWEEEGEQVATWRKEEEKDFEGEVHKNKRPLNLAHIFPKKAKEPETRTTRKLSQFDDDEEKETLLKR